MLNAVGAGVWAVTISTMGYVFGQAVGFVLPHAHHYQLAALIAVVFATIVFVIVRRVRTS